jgi:hypothetical protein
MRIVGLSGGIASGKSTVSRQLAAQGIPVLDCDLIAREATRKASGRALEGLRPSQLPVLIFMLRHLSRHHRARGDGVGSLQPSVPRSLVLMVG